MAKRILVLDDDEGILDGFTALLESEGYDVTVSPDPRYINTLSSKNRPDLILLDVLLSGEDGRDICRALKEQREMKSVPIIMMSAALNMEKSVVEAGASGFIRKPFEMDEMLKVISGYLEA